MLSNIHSFEVNNIRYAVITNQDITDRKKAEQELFEISERFQKSF